MRVLNKHLPSPLRDMDLGMLLRPNYKGFAAAGAEAAVPARRGSPATSSGRSPRPR